MFTKIEQKLNVPLGSPDRRVIQAAHGKRGMAFHKSSRLLENLPMCPGIRNHSPFAKAFSSRLELRLYQEHRFSGRSEDLLYARKNTGEGDKGSIHTAKFWGNFEMGRFEIACIGAFHHHHPGILTKLPVKLSISHIYRIDPRSSPGEQHFSKAPRGSPDVNAAKPLHGKGENLESPEELMRSSAHPFFFLNHPKIHILGELTAAFINTLPCHENFSRQNERPRPAP